MAPPHATHDEAVSRLERFLSPSRLQIKPTKKSGAAAVSDGCIGRTDANAGL